MSEERCPFCGFRKCVYQPSPALVEYECGTSKYGKDDFSRSTDCFIEQIGDLQAQLSTQSDLLWQTTDLLMCWNSVEGINWASKDNSGLEQLPIDTQVLLLELKRWGKERE